MTTLSKSPTAELEVAPSAADLNTLDESALMAVRLVDQEQQQALSASLIKADQARDAAFRGGAAGAQLDQLKAVREHIAAQLASTEKHQQEVEQALDAKRTPKIEALHAEGRAAAAAIQAAVVANVDDMTAAWEVIRAKAAAVAAAIGQAAQLRKDYETRCGDLVTQPARINFIIALPAERLERLAADMRGPVQGTVASLATRGRG